MKKKIFIVAAVITSGYLHAQDSIVTKQMDEVVITATKSFRKLSETGKVVTVITKEQIMRSGGKDLSQLLNEQTGITIGGANSNPGKDKSLFLLGATDKYTLILLDGVPLNEPSGVGGSFDLRLLSLDNVERIEILKGSQSTLYGSNAVAGVINIISKKSTHQKPELNGLATYGSYNAFKGNVNVGQRTKMIDYNLNYVYYRTDGISEAKDTTGVGNFDKDGFTQNAIQGTVGIHVKDKLLISPYFRFTEFKGGYDGGSFADAPNHYVASLVNTGLTGHFNYKNGTVHFNYGYDFTKRDYASPFSDFFLKGKFNQADVFVNHNFSGYVQLIAGLSYQSYHIDKPDTTNSITSPYASFLLKSKNGWNAEIGGRFNHHNQYGNNWTYTFNPSYLVNNHTKLFVNLTSGFRAPSIGELFGPFGANPRLKPEKSSSQEAGVQAEVLNKKLAFTATGFNRNINDVIIYGNNGYENRDKQHDFGAQFEAEYSPNELWNFKLTYAYVDGKITQKLAGKDTTFYNLIRRPRHTIHFFAGYQATKNLFVSTSVQVSGKRFDTFYDASFTPVQVTLKAYALWNAYAEYQFLKGRLRFFADTKNITGTTDYYEAYGYAVQGFTITTGLRFRL